ncbi:hypothetical protein PVAND_002601 [Polypedilum vanderplanki]|uniref:Uncharacterized protein n=1 Tax=Polypedilum vanderplanki TaxID=319348 RepID=A0A9J6BRV9_POLVA|nr:hypothetical protein PVAND_002601 [Polypedilum vanderplanki]
MTERRKFPAYDCEIFENNGLDDRSTIMKMFENKNKRVNKIFDNDEAEENELIEKEKSFDLHLISRRDSNENKVENEGISCNVKKLPSINIANNNEGTILKEVFKQPETPKAKSGKHNVSLRRRVITQQEYRPFISELPCSTPISKQVCHQESFLNMTESINNLSPIRKEITKTPEKDNRNNHENKATNDKINFNTNNIEMTPKRKNRENATPILKDFSLQVQLMEISNQQVSNYRQNQMKKLSINNQTNINSVEIDETPLQKHVAPSIRNCDSALAKRLQLCDSNSSSEHEDNSQSKEEKKIETIRDKDFQENLHKEILKNPDMTEDDENDKDELEKFIFKKPSLPDTQNRKQVLERNSTPETFKVSQNLVDSLDAFRRSYNDPSSYSQASQIQSKRFSILPKNATKVKITREKKNISKLASISKIIKRKSKNGKRALFSQNFSLEEKNDQQTLSNDNDNLQEQQSKNSNTSSSSRITDILSEKKSIISKEREELTSKTASKRSHSPASTKKEPPNKRRTKKVLQVQNNQENDQSDEGFESEECSRTNIKYNPDEICARKGLRIRRYPRLWWRHDDEANNYGIIYDYYKKKDYIDEIKSKKVMKKNVVKKTQNNFSKESTSSTSDLQTNKSVSTSKEIEESNTNLIKKVFENLSSQENIASSKRKINEAYDLQQINAIKWTACGEKIYFHQFVDNKTDGFIKFLPGAEKTRAKTKRSALKFVLLCGKIDFYVNGEKETLENLGYISIQPNNCYYAKNPYDEEAILTFTKLELPETELSISALC